jgi:DNA-binding LacI/PurR family transcriptional regulator
MHDPDIWFVGTDHELGGFLAGEHLIQLGYKKLGYIHGGKGNILGEVRKNGFCRALNEYGINFNSKYIYYLKDDLDRYHSGYSVGKEFVKLEDRPEAIFIYTDSAAIGFQRAILEEGWKIPDDISVIGYNDIASAKFAPVPLTTIRQQTDLIWPLAAETVIKRINGEESPNRIIVKPLLIARQSTTASEVSKVEAISLE